MDQENIAMLGNVTNLRIRVTPDAPSTYSLLFRSASGEQQQCLFTEGGIRLLWHYLTEILYPRAAGSLTSKSATAATRLTSSMSAIFLLKVTAKDGQIEVVGESAVKRWVFRISREDGYELWTALEDVLHNVQSKEDE